MKKLLEGSILNGALCGLGLATTGYLARSSAAAHLAHNTYLAVGLLMAASAVLCGTCRVAIIFLDSKARQ